MIRLTTTAMEKLIAVILTAENWMGIFLKTNIADNIQLVDDPVIQKDAALNLYFIEQITNQYLKTAENH